MKDRIVLFVIGVLFGAVIATGSFYVYTTNNSCNCSNSNSQLSAGQPPDMPSVQNGQPPEKPGENNTTSNTQSNSN